MRGTCGLRSYSIAKQKAMRQGITHHVEPIPAMLLTYILYLSRTCISSRISLSETKTFAFHRSCIHCAYMQLYTTYTHAHCTHLAYIFYTWTEFVCAHFLGKPPALCCNIRQCAVPTMHLPGHMTCIFCCSSIKWWQYPSSYMGT